MVNGKDKETPLGSGLSATGTVFTGLTTFYEITCPPLPFVPSLQLPYKIGVGRRV
jgi:hypothetical protein